ncbi:MAG: ABC transporter permease, partial [Anaerolineae bacterium]|nr:ABC transporter permease [Anaerolineae bacterium]
ILETITVERTGKRAIDKLILLRQRLAESPEIVALVTLILVFLFFAFSAPNFLTAFALSNVLTFSSVFGIVVVGVAFLMISGEFDLSVGSVLALGGFVFLLTLRAGVPPLLAMLLALGISALLGLINGLIVILLKIPSFIATLGTLLAYRGIVRALGAGQATSYTPDTKPALFAVLNGFLSPINELFEPAGNFRVSSLWFIGLVIIMSFILMRTRHGNWTFAVGGNSAAALAQAVNVTRVKLTNFTMSGFFAGLAGVILFAQRSSMNELIGVGLELTAVAAAVIGGVVLTGGSGTIIGAALGMLLLSMLEQGLVLLGVTNELFQGVVGAIIIVSVIVNVYLKRQDR